MSLKSDAFTLGAIAVGFGALFPMSGSAATTYTIGFSSAANAPTSTTNVSSSTVSGGFLTGVASSGDPRLIWNTPTVSSTPIVSKLETETWATIVFRVRETADPLTPGTVVNTFDATGLAIVLSSSNTTSGAVTVGSALHTAVLIDVDGFFTVTADISSFTANDIRYLRLDPIGASDAGNNRFEVDFIQINAVPEPSAAFFGSLGMLGLLRRRR
jgi:hypothetical protein